MSYELQQRNCYPPYKLCIMNYSLFIIEGKVNNFASYNNAIVQSSSYFAPNFLPK